LPYESRNIYANVDAVCFSMLFGGYNLHHDNSSYMPQSLTHVVFNDNPTKIYEYSFYKCKYLQTIELGDEVVEIEEMAFVDCESLKNFDIPAKTEKIGSYAFMGCDSLTSMTIPGRIKTISYGMLSDCNLLETVVIEEGVENISGNAFVLTKLKNLILPSTIKNIEQRAFGSDGLEWVVLSEGSCLETIAKDAFLDYNMTKKFFVFEEKNSFEQKVGVLDSVDIYYYSDKNPTTEGNYWHYVNNKPTPW